MGHDILDDDGLGEYRIVYLINKQFQKLPLENIDFKRHMLPNIALNKKVTMLPNGRPDKAEYYNGTDLVAEIRFEFIDSSGLMIDRKEYLYYVKQDIVSSMKAFLSGILMSGLGQSLEQVVETITPFWDACKIQREHFTELGKTDWKTWLENIDLNITPYTYLAIDIGGGTEGCIGNSVIAFSLNRIFFNRTWTSF